MKKIRILALTAVFALSLMLSSCNVLVSSPDDLMVPPYPTGELQEVQEALRKKVDNFKLVYPKTEKSRAAFVKRSFDQNKTECFLAFYSTEKDPQTHINLLCKEGDKWTSVYDFETTAGKLEEIIFQDLDGDGVEEIISSWSLFGAVDRQLNVFIIKEKKLTTVFEEKYAGYALCDINGDDIQEIVLINRDPNLYKATAQIYSMKSSRFFSLGSVPLDGSITEYAKISIGKKTGDADGIYIDAYKNDGMITDVVYMKNGIPESGFMKNTPGYVNNETYRSQAIVSSDIDKDGRIEIPIMKALPGYDTKKPNEQASLTYWKRYDGTTFEDAFTAVNNITDGYYLKYPKRWIDKVTLTRDSEKRERIFCLWNGEEKTFGVPLLKIRVFSEQAWKDLSGEEWFPVKSKSGFIYAAQIYEYQDFTMSMDELIGAFHLTE